VISPLLANIYLNPLDHLLADAGFEMVRYADDFVILCRSEAAAGEALGLVEQWVAENGLTLHPTKTRIADARSDEGFQFLGYWFKKGRIRDPRPKSLKKLKATLRPKTKRANGRSLQAIIVDVNQTLRGWFGYFRHCHWTIFRALDQWLRDRLRSILRKHQRRRGRARSPDHQRWPNVFFTEQGLYSLSAAHVSLCQSCLR
jgi:RNA-directed DNA polymerase